MSHPHAARLRPGFRQESTCRRDTGSQRSAHYRSMDAPTRTRDPIRRTNRSPWSEPIHWGPIPSAPGRSHGSSKKLAVRRGPPDVKVGSVAVGAFLALVILTTPLAIAAPPTPTANSAQIGAPFTGAIPFASYSAVGCGSFGPALIVPPAASVSNGSVRAA